MFDKIFSDHLFDEEIDILPIINLDDSKENLEDVPSEIPIVPMRNSVLFPGIVLPITVGREKSLRAVNQADQSDKYIGVITQKDRDIEHPNIDDLYITGTLARIVKVIRLPDGNSTVIIQGRTRFRINKFVKTDPHFVAQIELLDKVKIGESDKNKAMLGAIRDLAQEIVEISPHIPKEASLLLKNMDKPAFLIDFISSNLELELFEKQELLEVDDFEIKAEKVLKYLSREKQFLEIKNKIHNKVKVDIEKQQRDYFLNQQLKTIQDELGSEGPSRDAENLRERAEKKDWPKKAQKVFDKELKKLQRMNPAVAEYSVILNYLELLLDLPWNELTDDDFDLNHAERVLDRDHYGLGKIKQRILEYLAVLKLKGDMKSPILCFVGPPGVGKTSLGKSIANALQRKYIRMSLGGLHDESEIRGHRKTYIGAMPGRIIQSIKKAGSSNPLFVLDEIDKIGKDFRGDPSSALLEVLDPEQNDTFHDNFLEVDYDLSNVMFIATANSLSTIQPALRDRMEIIELSGYSLEEKAEIARKFLIPKQRENHGLKASHIKLSKKALKTIIQEYTKESGVRELERKIAAVMRSTAKSVAMEEKYAVSISDDRVREILGKKIYENDKYQGPNPPGVTVGLAWTPVGGDILFIETLTSKGNGKLTLTGNLGDVMKESASTALSYIKAHAEAFNIPADYFEKHNFHLHVPEGAIPKDGPSAGITMLTSMVSACTGKKAKSRFAMTGEITLRGKVLPVGGIKEKILAAKRAGLKAVVLCADNQKDVEEINPEYIKGIKFHYVTEMKDVLEVAL